ncbi:hypothetical protein LAZ67_15002295 [Cordylochernes scorpioides]|uniref:Annexin n=1 Tax=Cordylochernes scorpioides TaxID=51811 RepID=A0ABY6LC38_9ARAC|nr:hypothetical protein LAZ67_15002295 [Cordylochernes scorpioides]
MSAQDLIEDLKSELSGRFEDVILALMSPLPHFLARQLHKAVCGAGTNEDTLVEVLATRSNDEIRAINQAYHLLHNTTLEEDLVSDTSGNFRRLMVSLCSSSLNCNTVQLLLEAGEGQWGTDESTFNAIMAAQSFPQLRHVFYEYYQLTGRTIEQAISAEMSGDIKDGMLAIAKSVENRAGYFAEKLYKAMSGMGTDDCVLIRIVVSRSEIDLVQIKEMYEQTYGKSLAEAIAGRTESCHICGEEKTWGLVPGRVDDSARQCQESLTLERSTRRCSPGWTCIVRRRRLHKSDIHSAKDSSDWKVEGKSN